MQKKRKKILLSRLQIAVITLAFAVIFITSNIQSLYIGLAKQEPAEDPAASSIPAADEKKDAASQGETGNDIYTIEMWEDGSVKIMTMQRYIQTPDDHTIVITDR